MTVAEKLSNVLPMNHRFNNKRLLDVDDHTKLLQIGSFFGKCFENSTRFFSFYSNDSDLRLQKSIIALASYFNYYHQKKVTVLINSYTDQWKRALPIEDSSKSVEFLKTLEGIELVEIDSLKKFCERTHHSFEIIIEQIVQESEVIFWEIESGMEKDREAFLPLWKHMEAVSVWVEKGKSKGSKLKSFLDICLATNKKVISFLMVDR